jgi:PEP-CTERM motif
MKTLHLTSLACAAALSALALAATPAWADPFEFSTGNPDGRIATLSRLASGGTIQTETADDFVLGQATRLTQASFIGLIPLGMPLSSVVSQVEIEFYHVFPGDSADPPSGKVPTRVNSPGDVEIGSATRDSADGSLSFSVSVLNPSYTASNSVVNGIHPLPGVFTGGEGAVTGQEVLINVTFEVPVELTADHYFFRPEALLNGGEFLWLSAAKPIAAPGTPFAPDLQTWIRNDDLAPDWLRIGTDITGQGPFNAAFSLTGEVVAVPEPATYGLMLLGLAAIGVVSRRRAHLSAMSTLSK